MANPLPGTAQQITNATNTLHTRIDAIFPVLQTIVRQLGDLHNLVEGIDGRVEGVEGQLQILNQQYNL
ncbi:hypothetical protein L211DRAFT_842095 [Terfezia boudieri ATCC MYA-4762]|uniref:Uncharacterized protein n=1 Tax=Terfezia boudieri ATCC MYA-4762 TaxID=1051890 RepID=A0A3N4LHB8_9PEZI|nr:hypothetical protein L211DRAFT_842095 [Terfezia boudieri ATCC MYA-4762]